MYVVEHSRDCDGTPLYGMSDYPIGYPTYEDRAEQVEAERTYHRIVRQYHNCYGEQSLTQTGLVADRFYPDVWEFCKALRGEACDVRTPSPTGDT